MRIHFSAPLGCILEILDNVYRWEANSFGYHGDDGFLYHGQGRGESFGPTYTRGDIVGGGINYASQKIFFTYASFYICFYTGPSAITF